MQGGRRMVSPRLILSGLLVAGAALGAISAFGNLPEKVLYTDKLEKLSAVVHNRADWCQPEIEIGIRAEAIEKFQGDRRGLQRMLGQVRAILDLECPVATSLRLTGLVDNAFVYDGLASRETNWTLFEVPAQLDTDPQPAPTPQTPPPPVQQPQRATVAAAIPAAPEVDHVELCDKLASHPDDPEKPAGIAGVEDDRVDAAAAIRTCQEAIEEEPDEPRLRFQLARAYLFTDRNEDALDLLVEAAKEGHGGSLAYLGDVMLYGAGGLESEPDIAKSLYLHAAEAGFKPAKALADQIIADAKPDTEQASNVAVTYHRKSFVDNLAAGDAIKTNETWGVTVQYVLGILVGVKEECATLLPNRDWIMDYQKAAMKRVGQNEAWNLAMLRMSGALDELSQQGMDDGYGLAVTEGCKSAKTKNMVIAAARYFD